MSSADRDVLFPSFAFLVDFISFSGDIVLVKFPEQCLVKVMKISVTGLRAMTPASSPVTLLLAVGVLDDCQQVEVF